MVLVLPLWPISKYPCNITEYKDRKKQVKLVLVSWYKPAPANYYFIIISGFSKLIFCLTACLLLKCRNVLCGTSLWKAALVEMLSHFYFHTLSWVGNKREWLYIASAYFLGIVLQVRELVLSCVSYVTWIETWWCKEACLVQFCPMKVQWFTYVSAHNRSDPESLANLG